MNMQDCQNSEDFLFLPVAGFGSWAREEPMFVDHAETTSAPMRDSQSAADWTVAMETNKMLYSGDNPINCTENVFRYRWATIIPEYKRPGPRLNCKISEKWDIQDVSERLAL